MLEVTNTLTRAKEPVRPRTPGRVTMYTCGPTVYRYAHVGNLRTFLLADLVRRALEAGGAEVHQVQNITDVGHMTNEQFDRGEDRMLVSARLEDKTPAEIADHYTESFLRDVAALNLRPAAAYPRASDYIPQMLELVAKLLERGHAYEVEGTVYFAVESFPGYGRLSRNTLDRLRAGHRQEEVDPRKRHHADFALWKAAGHHRSLKWDSPWGEGFPGWHIECSAMSMDLLGDRFDVHTGGNDNKFPHHEDEIAQSEGAVDHQVVSIWVHGGFLQMSGQKMAKSAKNIYRVTDLRDQGVDPLAYRLLCFGTQYRSEMDFSWEALEGQNQRLKELRRRMADWAPPGAEKLGDEAKAFDARFREALADDLSMPTAVVVLNEAVRSAAVPDDEKYRLLADWDAVLGLDLERDAGKRWEPSDEVRAKMEERDAARGAKDYATSDRIRDELEAIGLEVMDTPDGTRVRLRD